MKYESHESFIPNNPTNFRVLERAEEQRKKDNRSEEWQRYYIFKNMFLEWLNKNHIPLTKKVSSLVDHASIVYHLVDRKDVKDNQNIDALMRKELREDYTKFFGKNAYTESFESHAYFVLLQEHLKHLREAKKSNTLQKYIYDFPGHNGRLLDNLTDSHLLTNHEVIMNGFKFSFKNSDKRIFQDYLNDSEIRLIRYVLYHHIESVLGAEKYSKMKAFFKKNISKLRRDMKNYKVLTKKPSNLKFGLNLKPLPKDLKPLTKEDKRKLVKIGKVRKN
ncbi:Uncharacterised protein [uncultured archaeon]|nr:Uncharacterised protein [uncultured archaeon]